MNHKFYNIAKKFNVFPFKLLPKITNQKLIFPFYHCVSDITPIHIKHLYKIRTISEFENDLDFLLKYYEPIDYKILLDILFNGKKFSNSFLLTFDDGLNEFYDIVAPILQKKGIPCICFLNSNFIDNKDLFYRFKASILIEALNTKIISGSQKGEIKSWICDKGGDYENINNFILSVKYIDKNYLDELAGILKVNFDQYLKQAQPYLSGNKIKKLISQGFHFGAHSIDHPYYTEIKEEEQLFQTRKSIDSVINKFNLNYRLFSFPFDDTTISRLFFEIIFNKNNPIADLTFGTSGLKKDPIKYNFQRIPMEKDGFSAYDIICGEYLYYMAKSFTNKNTIKRM